MALRTIFIVWSHPLFRDSIRILLKSPVIEIVGTESRREKILAKIKLCEPEIIIVEESIDDTPPHIDALQILRECSWKACVIRLSLRDNELWLYQHERGSIKNADHLMNVVQDSWITQGKW